MPDSPEGQQGSPSDAPAPEVLKPQADTESPEASSAAPSSPNAPKPPTGGKPRRTTYRPSHKATFIGLGVVVAILAINAGILYFLMSNQGSEQEQKRQEVTLSSDQLDKLGVSRSPVGNLGTELIVGPDSRFNGKVTIGNDVDISGQLRLNSSFTANGASLSSLQAGATTLSELNVNGASTAANLTLRENLDVVGTTRLQGAVTVNNSLTVAGNLTVGGALFTGSFQANVLVSGSTLTIGGHIITKGSVPGVSAGGAVGSNGTVSISGNDASGTVAVNVGVGGGNGTLATVTFKENYVSTPHVVVTAVNRSAGSIYITRNASGFSIHVGNALSPGGYAFDYMVMQ